MFMLLDINPPSDAVENIHYVFCDVASALSVEKAVHDVVGRCTTIDMLFANAGIHFFANIEDVALEEIDHMLSVNLKGVVFALRYVLPHMRRNHAGSIVLCGSDQSIIGKKQSAIYGATKAAVAQLAKSIAIDYAEYNIRCNCICPGTTDTSIFQAIVEEALPKYNESIDKIVETFVEQQPIKRIGLPQEIAKTVMFLLSNDSSFTTGALFSVDGGYTAV